MEDIALAFDQEMELPVSAACQAAQCALTPVDVNGLQTQMVPLQVASAMETAGPISMLYKGFKLRQGCFAEASNQSLTESIQEAEDIVIVVYVDTTSVHQAQDPSHAGYKYDLLLLSCKL